MAEPKIPIELMAPADPAQSAPSAEEFVRLEKKYGSLTVGEAIMQLEAAALRTAQLERESESFQFDYEYEKQRREAAEERVRDLEKFLRGVQEYDCPKQCDQKKNHHTAFCTNARALLTVAAQTPGGTT